MEEDGKFQEELDWEYSDALSNKDNLPYATYNGDGPSLCLIVPQCFDTVLATCSVAGDFSYKLTKMINVHTNACVRSKLIGYQFYGKR